MAFVHFQTQSSIKTNDNISHILVTVVKSINRVEKLFHTGEIDVLKVINVFDIWENIESLNYILKLFITPLCFDIKLHWNNIVVLNICHLMFYIHNSSLKQNQLLLILCSSAFDLLNQWIIGFLYLNYLSVYLDNRFVGCIHIYLERLLEILKSTKWCDFISDLIG